MEKKVFSIITPSFNQGQFIPHTIESILTQEGDFYIDYIVMDGGSTDGLVDEVKKYEKLLKDNCDREIIDGVEYYVRRDPDFKFNRCLGISYRWWSKPDKGQSDAINQGFSLAQGDYATWLNSDDFFYPGTLQVVAETFAGKHADVVVGNATALNGKGEPIWEQLTGKPTLCSLLFRGMGPPQPSTFFTIELFRRAGGVNEELHYTMDGDLWIKLCFLGAKFVKIERNLSAQTYHEDSKSMQGEEMFAKFKPENDRLRAYYRSQLTLEQYWWCQLKRLFPSTRREWVRAVGSWIPKPLKDILNKIIARITHRV